MKYFAEIVSNIRIFVIKQIFLFEIPYFGKSKYKLLKKPKHMKLMLYMHTDKKLISVFSVILCHI